MQQCGHQPSILQEPQRSRLARIDDDRAGGVAAAHEGDHAVVAGGGAGHHTVVAIDPQNPSGEGEVHDLTFPLGCDNERGVLDPARLSYS